MGKSKKKISRPPQYVAKANRKKEPMDKRLKYGLIGGAAVLVVAVLLFFLLYDDGSLPVKNGTAVAEDNWIVANLGENSKKYFKLGAVSTPEGFVLDPQTHYQSDTNVQDFYYKPVDEAASRLQSVYYMGAKGGLSTLVESAHSTFPLYYPDAAISDIVSATISDHPVQYFSMVRTETQEEADNRAAAEGADVATDDAAAPETEPTAEAAPDNVSGEGAADATPAPEAETAPEAEAPVAVPKTTQTVTAYVAAGKGIIICQLMVDVTDANPALTEDEISVEVEKSISCLAMEPFQ